MEEAGVEVDDRDAVESGWTGNSTGVDMRLDEQTDAAELGIGFVLCLAPRRRESEANGAAKRLAVLPERDGNFRAGRGCV